MSTPDRFHFAGFPAALLVPLVSAAVGAVALYLVAPIWMLAIPPLVLLAVSDWRSWLRIVEPRSQQGWRLTTLDGTELEAEQISARLLPAGFCILLADSARQRRSFLIGPWQCRAEQRALLLGLIACRRQDHRL